MGRVSSVDSWDIVFCLIVLFSYCLNYFKNVLYPRNLYFWVSLFPFDIKTPVHTSSNLLFSYTRLPLFDSFVSFRTNKSKQNGRPIFLPWEVLFPEFWRKISSIYLLREYQTKPPLSVFFQSLTGRTKTSKVVEFYYMVPRYKPPSYETWGSDESFGGFR